MDAVVERLLGLGALAFAVMLAVYGVARAATAPLDPWAPRPAVRVARSHGWPPAEMAEITDSARPFLVRVFGLR
jgi:hypothetical protein